MQSKNRLLIVDDDPGLTGMLQDYLEAEGFDVGVVYSGEEALPLIGGKYDAIILDLMLPGMSGTDVLRHIREFSSIPVIMLTANGDRVARANGLEIGADDYVAKPYFPRELVARVRAVLRRQGNGRNLTGRIVFRSGNLEINTVERTATCDGQPLDLTATEFALLLVFVQAESAALNKGDLSQQVLRREWQPYDRSIDMHVSKLRQKLAQVDGPAIETVRGFGYRMQLDP